VCNRKNTLAIGYAWPQTFSTSSRYMPRSSRLKSFAIMGENFPLPGARVMVHGLRQHPKLNGHFGVVLDDSDLRPGRFAVRIEATGKVVGIKPDNFTCVKTTSEVISIGDDGPAFDPSKMLRGDCVMCLGEARATRAIVPCGHLCICVDCTDDVLKHRRCPVCRHFISALLKVFVTGSKRDTELDEAISRAKAAEEQVARLTERLKRPRIQDFDDTPLVCLARRGAAVSDDTPLVHLAKRWHKKEKKEKHKKKEQAKMKR